MRSLARSAALPWPALILVLWGCAVDSAGLGATDAGTLPDAGVAIDAASASDAATPLDAAGADAGAPEDSGSVPPDAGPPSFYDLAWGPAALVDLLGTPDPCAEDRALDPILTSDRRWLYVSRFESDCSVRRFHVFAWNDGAPAWVAMLGPLVSGDTEHNGHLWNGAPAGRPDDELLLFTVGGAGTPRELRTAWLGGSPPLTPLEACSPSRRSTGRTRRTGRA